MKNIVAILILLNFCLCVRAQDSEPLSIRLGTLATAASEGYQPLWHFANRWGSIRDQGNDLSTYVSLAGKRSLAKEDSSLSMEYGADVFNNRHFGRMFIQQAYLKMNYRKIYVVAGRFKMASGNVDPDLSSGSLGISANALPIPKLGIAMSEYADVPFTNGFLTFKGAIYHGWMGKDRYFQDAFLHQKELYVKAGKNRLKFYAGIQHFAEWGGRRADFTELDRSFKGFLNVLLVKEANDGSVDFGDSVLTHKPNRAGDHRGVIEVGGEYDADNFRLNFYNQTPFDMGQGIDIRNIDRLLGVTLTNKKKNSTFKKYLLEFLYTKQMNNFYSLYYRENYYNNGTYKTGWEYKDMIIGTPLFVNRHRGSKYFDDVEPIDWNDDSILGNANIINNRVVGVHLGSEYAISKAFFAKSLFTYTRNFGTYHPGPFQPKKDQVYTLQQVGYKFPESNISVSASIAGDFGQLTNNFGGMLGLEWRIF